MSWDPATTTVVYNPRAANGRVGREWRNWEGLLRRELGEVRCVATQGPADAIRCAREAVEGGAKTVLSVGGDGTHNEVTNGILQTGKPDITLGILPAGTGGDFRRLLAHGADFATSARALSRARRDRIDAGKVTFRADDGTTQQRYVINIVSFGIAGLVDRIVNSTSKALGGTAAFYTGTLRAMARYRPARVRLTVDGAEAGEFDVTNIMVCNGRFAGGGMMFAPTAKLDDGMFEVIVLKHASPLSTLALTGTIYQGKHLNSPIVKALRGRVVRAETVGDAKAWVDIDGEAPGTLPIEVELLPGALWLLDAKDDVVAAAG
jgi:YegS/Rv2252/BmrU family lipid kinase